jgi:hypothetical protein
MVDLLKVTLFAEFVVGRPSLFSDDSGLVQLFLKLGQFIGKLGVFAIDLGDLRQGSGQTIVSLVLAPLLLECLQSPAHAKLDEEVSNELI